jgi:hypothetical protein
MVKSAKSVEAKTDSKQSPGIHLFCWDFRANEESYTITQLLEFCKQYGKKWAFQKEKGDSGYTHWQGRISLFKRKFKHQVWQYFKDENLPVPNYLEPTVDKEYRTGSQFYVLKKETRVEGPWTDRTVEEDEKNLPRFVCFANVLKDTTNMYPFQLEVLNSGSPEILQRDLRVINLVVDVKGNSGKSSIAKYIHTYRKGYDMPVLNDFEKIIYTTCNILKGNKDTNPGIMLFDLPRAMAKNKLHGIFSAFEQIKKGYVYDLRNKYKDWDFIPPSIWVFVNEDLDLSLLSKDRWHMYKISSLTHSFVEYAPSLDNITRRLVRDI